MSAPATQGGHKKKIEVIGTNIMACPITMGGHKKPQDKNIMAYPIR